jgi:pimeloyl-ACP methyl ester carboxylesterase
MAKIERTIDNHSWIWNDLDKLAPCLILFIHGYTGHAENTWQRFPHLIRQVGQGFETGFDVASFGYKTSLAFNTKSIEVIAGLFSSFISAHANQYQQIFIVAHSLGGVVSRCLVPQLFDKKPAIFHKIRQIHFIGVPHYGIGHKKSWIVNLMTFFPGMRLSQQLTADSPTLVDILGRWDKLLRQVRDDQIELPQVANYVGSEDWVAPYRRIIGEFNRQEAVEMVEETHLSLAKPHGPENTLYTLVKQSIQSEADIGVKKNTT